MSRETSNISAGQTANLADAVTSPDDLVREREAAMAVAGMFSSFLRRDLEPGESLVASARTASEFVIARGYGDPDRAPWTWILEPAYDLPRGWSSEGGDPEGAALARERFFEAPVPTVVAIPDAETVLAVPLLSREDPEGSNNAVGLIAIPLLADSVPDENCVTVMEAIAAVVGVHMENSVRAQSASRSLQFAQAAARTQRQLVEPLDRAGALRIAVDALKFGEDLTGVVAIEIIDQNRREVASFGDIEPDPEELSDEDPAAGDARLAVLPVLVDDVVEAEITVRSFHNIGDVESDTLNSIASAVAGSIARFRANATIESLRRSATRRLVEAQERERSMIAADIHDGVLQQLGATAIRLELAQSRVEQGDFGTASAIIADGANEIRSCARELRALLMELRPQVLDDNGLNAALSELGRHVAGVDVRVNSEVPDDLGSEFSITIFRIVQEALTNIEKHAQAETASVDVDLDGHTISIEINDDGIGYEGAVTGPSAEGSHLGLLGMRERAQMFGGTFSIAGSSGGGTEIKATLPLTGLADRAI